jgi:nucleobase:cation symporter-1, NCS1 family
VCTDIYLRFSHKLKLLDRAASVTPSIKPTLNGIEKIYYMFYFWGYTSAFVVYCVLCHIWPEKDTMIPATIYDDSEVIDGRSDERSLEVPDEKRGSGVAETKV